jgi:protein-disulfide isomerase
VTLSRRHFLATGSSLGVLTLAACSSDPIKKAEAANTATETTPQAPAETATATAPSGKVELYDGSAVKPLGTDPLLNPEGVPDRPIGGKNAKAIVIEYSSPTCSHCAAFAIDTFPEFRKKYIDTGKVTFILRPFVRNVLDAVVFMLAEAAGDDKYVDVVETYFETVHTWATSETPRDEIEKIALQLGFSKESFEAALTNQDLFAALDDLRQQAMDKFDVTGTPTFFINGDKIVGAASMDALSKAIDPIVG